MTIHSFKPDLPPPTISIGALGWLRANLFSSWINTLLTLVGLYLLWLIVPPVLEWAIFKADWTGDTRADCSREGACWVFVQVRFGQFMYGFYPTELRWRVDAAAWLAIIGAAPLFLRQMPHKLRYGIGYLLVYPLLAYWLLHGGFLGLQTVPTSQWGGLMLTLVIAAVGIAGAMPFGILFALGRRSELPVIKAVSIAFIEFWRGVPLISVLFMSSVMLPLFFPPGWTIDKVMRALIGVSLFSGAYMAEVIRGGLQAIPKGQYEAADALGLGYWQSMRLVILPQALRLVIPGIVNSFISLFKDTSLVFIMGLYDLLGIARLITTSQDWLGHDIESYIFAAFGFWIFCFAMSRYSQGLERRLQTGHKH